mmetsp:Transcript_43050/g.48139  ORF Transcript_43050/g.48139 Transcript_43050/m.48139 type:complete len:429 (+) Transcript_43050:1-1287(+)
MRMTMTMMNSSSSSSSSNFTFFQAFDDYASHRHNIFPHKVHLAEMNPTIAKLPDRYLTDPKWLQAFGSNSGGRGGSSNDNTGRGWGSRSEGVGIPLYIATYRVTEYHDCFQSSHTLAIKFGGDYPNWLVKKRHQKLNYLGLALLDENLDIVTDITVTLEGIQSSNRRGKEGIFIKKYEDYRVFNLRGGNNSWNGNGDGDNDHEQLYLTTYASIVPIQLSLLSYNNNNNTTPLPNSVELPPAFPSKVSSSNKSSSLSPSFRVWARDYVSCTGSDVHAKNLMYFDKSISTTNTSPTTTTITSTNSTRRNPTKKEIRVVYFPNIPINVHSVDLDQKCNMTLNANNPPNRFQQISPPLPSFDTMDKEMFKNFEHNDLSGQRGSGCCTRIQKNQIPTAVATTATTTTKTSPSSHNNNNDDDGDEDKNEDEDIL